MLGRDGGIGDSGGHGRGVVAAAWLGEREGGRPDCRSVAGLVEEVRNTKRRRRASAKGDQRLVLQGRRSRSQAGTARDEMGSSSSGSVAAAAAAAVYEYEEN
jgi:hypothetical protein